MIHQNLCLKSVRGFFLDFEVMCVWFYDSASMVPTYRGAQQGSTLMEWISDLQC